MSEAKFQRTSARISLMLLLTASIVAGLLGALTYFGNEVFVAADSVGPLLLEPKSENHLRLLIIGDTGSQDRKSDAVAKALNRFCKNDPSLSGIVLLGDNFYPAGVTSIDDPQWTKAIWRPFSKSCLKSLPIYPILGNHDRKGNAHAQVAYSKINPRWNMPGRFYGVKFAETLHLIQTDSTRFDSYVQIPGGYIDTLQQQLAESDAAWKVVTSHHPVMSNCSKRPGREDAKGTQLLARAFCPHSNLWLSGHVHLMEHGGPSPDCKAEQFIIGSGGGSLSSADGCTAESKFNARSHGFAVLDASPDLIKIQFFNTKGDQLYEWQQRKQPVVSHLERTSSP